jgi:hypothetical protein
MKDINPILKHKFDYLRDSIIKMKDARKILRPSCEQILKSEEQWILKPDEIKSNPVFNIYMESSNINISINDSFHKFFLRKKLEIKFNITN